MVFVGEFYVFVVVVEYWFVELCFEFGDLLVDGIVSYM